MVRLAAIASLFLAGCGQYRAMIVQSADGRFVVSTRPGKFVTTTWENAELLEAAINGEAPSRSVYADIDDGLAR